MALQVRRVVTGHDKDGRAIVQIDEVSQNLRSARPGATACVIWTSEGFPIDNTGADDEGRRVLVKGNAELLEGPVVLRQSQTYALWIEKATREGWLEEELTMAAEPFWYFRVRPSRVITSNGPWAKRYKHYEW